MQQQTAVAAKAQQPRRDPQNFTPGDVLAWKAVAYSAAGLTVAGATAAIIVFGVVPGS
jgi:hypothetical protein